MAISQAKIREQFKNHPVFTEIHRGMNFGFMAKRGYYSRPDVLEQPKAMAKCGVNFCTFNVNVCQETYYSRRVFQDYVFSSGDQELCDMAKSLNDNGIHPMLKPCLTPLDGAWMGNVIMPGTNQIQGVSHNYAGEWFASYTDAICNYAEFSEKNNIAALMIGAEDYGMEGWSDHWRKLIEKVRAIYSGPLTYEFTFMSLKNRPMDWINDLDFISYSYYPPAQALPAGTPYSQAPVLTLEDMVNYLSPRKEKIKSIVEQFDGMPIAFTEIGVRSAHGCTSNPCDFMQETYYDGEEQANYMEAVFRTFSGIPQWMGLYWWKWDETQNRPHYHTDPHGDKGFTIQGKPAEKVLLKHYK